MEGIWFTWNRQNILCFFFLKVLAGNPAQPLEHANIVVLRSPPPWVFCYQILGAFFSKLKFCVLFLKLE